MLSPLVSIILPTYNGKQIWLSQTINSVIYQTYTNRELIIINDASINNIEQTILECIAKDKRIKYYKNEENIKLTKTLNKWIELSQWYYIARIDDDDVWHDPMKLEKQVIFMEQNTNYGLCGTGGYIIDKQGTIWDQFIQRQHDQEIRKNLLASNQFTHSSVLIRKNVFDNVGFYDLNYNLVEDYELRLRIWIKYKLYNLSDPCIYYRINIQSVSHKYHRKQDLLSLKMTFLYKKYYPWFCKALIKKIIYFILPTKVSYTLLKIFKKWIQNI